MKFSFDPSLNEYKFTFIFELIRRCDKKYEEKWIDLLIEIEIEIDIFQTPIWTISCFFFVFSDNHSGHKKFQLQNVEPAERSYKVVGSKIPLFIL